ncbi:hypothetical protein TSMEX_005078 [Taenia solium]|eukprot:TsM_000512900 transcript=TsM_000512900 gene=TsM_000512900
MCSTGQCTRLGADPNVVYPVKYVQIYIDTAVPLGRETPLQLATTCCKTRYTVLRPEYYECTRCYETCTPCNVPCAPNNSPCATACGPQMCSGNGCYR